MKIENRMSGKRSLKRELLNERANKIKTTTSKLKKGYKRYKEQKEQANKSATSADPEELEDKEITSLQEEFFEELIDIDKSVATAKGRYDFVETAINKMQLDEGEKEIHH